MRIWRCGFFGCCWSEFFFFFFSSPFLFPFFSLLLPPLLSPSSPFPLHLIILDGLIASNSIFACLQDSILTTHRYGRLVDDDREKIGYAG